MSLTPPPFKELAPGLSQSAIHERNSINVGQLRQMLDGHSDDTIVWLAVSGKNSPVRPGQHIAVARNYVLIS